MNKEERCAWVQRLFFDQAEVLQKEQAFEELTAMQNSQPPEHPTFLVGQTEIKEQLQQQLERSFANHSFYQVVIVGEIGGGKTHLLNLIKSRLVKADCYCVQFRAEEAEQAQYSFPKMLIRMLFKQHYNIFKQVFSQLSFGAISVDADIEELCNLAASQLSIDYNLARILCFYQKVEAKKSFALRILGGNESVSDLKKVDVTRLTDRSYMQILTLFLNYNPERHLIVMLDEFEHSYTMFTPAKRRDFLKGYKAFIDYFSQKAMLPLILITAATAQYNGQLQERIGKVDTALADRLKSHTLFLQEFDVTDVQAFTELFRAIAERFKLAYGHDVGPWGALAMRQRLFATWETGSAQRKTYRDIITTMLGIMNEMKLRERRFAQVGEAKVEEHGTLEKEQKNLLPEKFNYDHLKKHVEKIWENTKSKSRNTLVKKGMEAYFKIRDDNFSQRKVFLGRGSAALLAFQGSDGIRNYIYLALNDVNRKLISYKKEQEQNRWTSEPGKFFFAYLPEKNFENWSKLYPDIIPIDLEPILLELILLGNMEDMDETIKGVIVQNVSKYFKDLE